MESKKRVRIVKKEKDGITLRAKSNVQKMTWNEFNAGWKIVDNVWAEPSDELIAEMEEVNEHISSAAAEQLMANATEGDPTKHMTHVLAVGYHMQKIQELINCNMFEAANLVRGCLNSLTHDFGSDRTNRKNRRHQKRSERNEANNSVNTVAAPETTENAILSDNPILAKLKAEMEN